MSINIIAVPIKLPIYSETYKNLLKFPRVPLADFFDVYWPEIFHANLQVTGGFLGMFAGAAAWLSVGELGSAL